jgi:hypothetical protein
MESSSTSPLENWRRTPYERARSGCARLSPVPKGGEWQIPADAMQEHGFGDAAHLSPQCKGFIGFADRRDPRTATARLIALIRAGDKRKIMRRLGRPDSTATLRSPRTRKSCNNCLRGSRRARRFDLSSLEIEIGDLTGDQGGDFSELSAEARRVCLRSRSR